MVTNAIPSYLNSVCNRLKRKQKTTYSTNTKYVIILLIKTNTEIYT